MLDDSPPSIVGLLLDDISGSDSGLEISGVGLRLFVQAPRADVLLGL